MPHHSVTPDPPQDAQPVAGHAVGAALDDGSADVGADVAAAVARARAALPAWSARPAAERAAILRRFRDLTFQRRHEIAGIISRESGKTITHSFGIDVLLTLDFAAWTAAAAPRFLRSRSRGVKGLLFWRKRVRFDTRPIGVVGVIAPWNYPFFMPASGVLPALACGNTVVLKPSEFTPASAALLGPLLREAGLPEGVLGIVQGNGRTGAALVRGGVDKVVFTGSAATGRRIAMECAEQLIPCALELGGSDPAIVLSDADVRHAADGTVWTRFANTGQTCVATKRVYVEAPVYDAYLAAAARAVTALRPGPRTSPDTEFGPMIHAEAARKLTEQRDDALAKGARVVATAALPEGDAPGAHFAPTLLAEADESMLVLQEETFGPLLAVVKVRDAEEAIRRANDSTFGLSASVWTRDRARGLAVARRLEAGTVMINDASSVVGMADVPYGGMKRSGIGRMHGEAGLEEFVRITAVVDDRFRTWRQPWWFPYGPAHFEGFDAYARLVHGHTLRERLRGLPGIIRLLLTRKGTA
jgi:acyl-CoA reductase-like NAD-dependent aldehyde dehydrogenase